METDETLVQIVRELREANEYYAVVHAYPERRSAQERTDAAEELSSAVTRLESWLDSHGPQQLRDPHASDGGQPVRWRQQAS